MAAYALAYLMSDFEMREMRDPMYSDILIGTAVNGV
jgi:hypothetical protein